jgi:hybrid cluster-associated redox disulfide protein
MVTKDSNILEAVQKYPVIAQVFQRYGLGCIGCMVASGETLGEGISSHGLNADAVIAEINDIISKQEANK